MEKKEKPKLPTKPSHNGLPSPSLVTDAARRFEKIASENIDQRPYKAYKYEANRSCIYEANVVEPFVVTSHPEDDERQFDDLYASESTDDSSYYENVNTFTYNTISTKTRTPTTTSEEILSNEKSYIERLNFVIENYMLPSRIMGEQMKAIFGNIQEIKDFHENVFYPDLLQYQNDFIRLMECFSKHIMAGNFYRYNVYALNQNQSESERTKPFSKHFFQEVQNKIGDKMGVDGYLIEPIQRIFKYKNIIDSVTKKPKSIEILVAATKASHHLHDLLATTEMSMVINDIVDSKINLMKQGNFVTQNEIIIYDCNQKRKYKGNIFLFQKCVVCTEYISTKNHQFRSYFPYQTGHIECISENKFELSEGNNCKIEVTGESTNAIQKMITQIRCILNQMPLNEGNQYNSSDSENLKSDSDYGSGADSMGSIRSSGEYDVSSSEGYIRRQHTRNNVPQSPVPRAFVIQQNSEIIDEMLANESNYVEELTVGIQAYMTSDNQTDILEIFDIFRNIQQIKDFHKNSFYNFLMNCGKDVTSTSTVFSKCTQEGQFNTYILLAQKYYEAEPLFTKKPYRDYFEIRRKHTNENKGFEYYLRLPLNRFGTYIYYLNRMIYTLNINKDTAIIGASCSKAINDVERIKKEISGIINAKERKKVTRNLTNLFEKRP